MLVRECDACEEAPLSGVCVPVVGMMAPAMTDDYHLSSDGGGSEGRDLLIGAWRIKVPGGRRAGQV